jgi:7-cyano-7-deazaguanine synthase in queuosine biosynthesis
MARAETLALQDIRPNSGRCPWRIQFQVDNTPVNAFFRPPIELAQNIGSEEVLLVALPILCDLAAEVRPKRIELASPHIAPMFRQIFADAVRALLLEQDAYWCKSSITPLPQIRGKEALLQPRDTTLNGKRVVLGFSGGKDSIVSLFALLRAGYEVIPVLLNEGDRTWQDTRAWIPRLRELGVQPLVAYLSSGRRNHLREKYGSWYFSSYQLGWLLAILAMCAVEARAGIICLGIESSADYSFTSFRHKKVNHQHQKTTKHLKLIERFYQQVLHPDIKIASPIANVTDAEVLKALLTQVPRPFQEFSSCGASNWRSKHCGQCAKCAFIYALLYSMPQGKELALQLFRRDLFDDVELYRPWLDDRSRMPPACVGHRSEVWTAFEALSTANCDNPVLKKWLNSKLRRRVYSPNGQAGYKAPVKREESLLALPVLDAATLVKDWVNI